MPLSSPGNESTVESYIDNNGVVYLYEKSRWGSERMIEQLPQRLFVIGGSTYITDGQWWDSPEPLSNSSMNAASTATDTDQTTYYIQTRGPGLIVGSSYIPAQYRVAAEMPKDVMRKHRIVQWGIKKFSQDKLVAFEEEFWTPSRMNTAWREIQRWLPADLPPWELMEAEEVFMRAKRPVWMASVSLASARRHYFENRRSYNSYVLGRDETEEEREQRLNYSRDARVMASFYRAFTGPEGRISLLRKTKGRSAKRIVNAHDREYKEVYDRILKQFAELQHEVNDWFQPYEGDN